jgi:uncharacterized sodium:solute symporter family permease YidK
VRPSIERVLQTDPSECADSGAILPAVLQIFPQAAVVLLGGVVYALALSDVLANIDEAAEAGLIDALLAEDDRLSASGEFLYAVACAMRA